MLKLGPIFGEERFKDVEEVSQKSGCLRRMISSYWDDEYEVDDRDFTACDKECTVAVAITDTTMTRERWIEAVRHDSVYIKIDHVNALCSVMFYQCTLVITSPLLKKVISCIVDIVYL